MKRILTSLALIALAAPLSAMSPSELIQTIHNRIEKSSIQERRSTEQHHRVVTNRKKNRIQAPAKRIRHGRSKSSRSAHAVATKRTFHSLGEYHRTRKGEQRVVPNRHHHVTSRRQQPKTHVGAKLGHYVGNGWFVDDRGQYDEQYQQEDRYLWRPSPVRRQHAYRHYRRQWYLTYLYEHAEFDDKHGYHYGYFDHRGFEFDEIFYEYDRSYTYQDRLHGKGLFEHRFYRPMRAYAGTMRQRVWRSNVGDAQLEFHWNY